MIEVKNGNLATKNTLQLIHLCEKLNAESKVNHAGNSVLKNKNKNHFLYHLKRRKLCYLPDISSQCLFDLHLQVRQPLLDKSLKFFEEVRVQYQLLVKCLSQLFEVLEAFVDTSKSGSGQLDWLLHLFSLERKSNVTHFSLVSIVRHPRFLFRHSLSGGQFLPKCYINKQVSNSMKLYNIKIQINSHGW